MKKVIIVGATSGIGRELAKLLTKSGCKVGITGRRTELLNEIKKESPNTYAVKSLDVTDAINTIERLEELVTELGGWIFSNYKFRNGSSQRTPWTLKQKKEPLTPM
jgi:NADP-dependent 3-hydroxy acid dehydrogenase YdfG